MNEEQTEKLNKAYQEICRLEALLSQAVIPHKLERREDGWKISYPEEGKCVCSVIEYTGTQGARSDRLEIMGLLNAEERKFGKVVGYLTAENVFSRIRTDWERRQKRDSKMGSGSTEV